MGRQPSSAQGASKAARHSKRDADGVPIRVVSERTGIAPTTLRAWERRYGVVSPSRSDGAQRLYDERDIERIRLIARLAALGYPLAELARSSTTALEQLGADGGVAPRDGTVLSEAPWPHEARANAAVARLLRATRELDATTVRSELNQATATFGVVAALDLVFSPFLREIGLAWACKAMTVGHEHLASNIVRDVLGSLLLAARTRTATGSSRRASNPNPPTLVATTIGGELHEFGVLMSAIVAAHAGWYVLYLGPSMPAEDIVRIAREASASVVAIGLVSTHPSRRVRSELAVLREQLPANVVIASGGANSAEHQFTLRSAGVERLSSRDEFRELLDRQRKRTA